MSAVHLCCAPLRSSIHTSEPRSLSQETACTVVLVTVGSYSAHACAVRSTQIRIKVGGSEVKTCSRHCGNRKVPRRPRTARLNVQHQGYAAGIAEIERFLRAHKSLRDEWKEWR